MGVGKVKGGLKRKGMEMVEKVRGGQIIWGEVC